MLEKILDLKNTFEGKFLAVLMSVVLVFGMSNFAAFAEGDAGDSTGTPTEQPDPASMEPGSENPESTPTPDPNVETPAEQQVIQDTVQHGTEAGTNSGGAVVSPPAESNEVDEAVVTFETENAYVSVNDQTFSTPTITTLTTKLHKELKFVASPDTGFEIESVKAKNAAVAEVPITTQDGISTVAGDYVDSTLVITVKAKAVETDAPQANETTPITNDTKIAAGGADVNKLTEGAVTHKVTFTVEGEEYTSQDVEEGATCVEPASPDIPEGFVSFMGWYEKTAVGTGERFDFSTPITQDMELVAKFSDKWVVLFQNADGKIIATQEVANGQKAEAIDGPTPPLNQVFDAWYLDGAPYDFTTPITGNITLSPHFLNTYYVYYISKGSVVAPEVVPDGTVVGEPSAPTREGYTFSHWSTTEDDSAGPFDFTQPITQDMTLYGIWVPEKVNYTVVYWFEKPNIVGDAGTDLANYQFNKSQTKKALAGSTVKADELNASWRGLSGVDYGYYSHGDEVVVAGNGTTVLNVYFKRTLYTVTFNLDGGTMEFNEQTYTDSQYSFQAKYEQDIYNLWVSAANADLYKKDDGKTKGLKQWSGNKSLVSHQPVLTRDILGWDVGGKPTGSTTYTAHWDETREAQVNYWLQVPDDENLPGDAVRGKNGKWYSKDNVYTQNLVLGKDSGLNPKQIAGFQTLSGEGGTKDKYDFYYDRLTYKLSFNTMGGSSIDPVSNIRYEAPLAKYMENKTPTRDGFEFKGWYLDSDYYMPFDAASATMPNANLMLYAKWESMQYSAEFFTHEGDEAPVATQGIADDEYVKDPGTYKLGHFYDGLGEFEGWYWYLPGTQRLVSYSWETPVAGDVQLYAQWKTDGFKVTYEAGEGSGSAPVDENEYALDVLAPVQQDTGLVPPDGKIFVGWQVNGQGITYYPGNTVKVSGDITLVARYLNPNNVIYLKFDPNFEGGPDQVAWPAEKGDRIAMPDSLFDRVGYDFVSWNTSRDGLGVSYKSGDIMTLNATTTLYAQWEIKKFNLETDHDEHSTIDPGQQYTYSEDSLEVKFGADDGYGISSITVDGKALEGEELAKVVAAGKVTLDRKSDHRVKVTSASNTITVKKVWNDSLEEKPTIQIQLYKDGAPYRDPVEFSSGKTEYTFEDLPLDGKPAQDTYSVQEVTVGGANVVDNKASVPASAVGAIKGTHSKGTYDYVVQVSAIDNGYIITNTSNDVLLTISNKIVDNTIDSDNGLAQEFGTGFPGVSLKNGESKTIVVPKGGKYTVSIGANQTTWKTTYVTSTGKSGEGAKVGSGQIEIKENTTVAFTNTRVTKDFNVHKRWFIPTDMLDTAELPDSLSFDVYSTTHKPNTADPGPNPGEENTDLVLSNQSISGWKLYDENKFWTTKDAMVGIPNLPKATVKGKELFYGVVEDLTGNWIETHDGFSQWISGDTANLDNYFNSTKISGTKKWIDDGATHDSKTEVELVLRQSADGGKTWSDPLPNTPTWVGDAFTFSGVPSYHSEPPFGFYQYKVEEISGPEGYFSYAGAAKYEIVNEKNRPSLQTTKTVTSTGSAEGGSYKAGDVVTYDITVKNTGNIPLNNISIVDEMSNSGTALLSKDTIASLAPGASEKVTATYTVTQADVDANAVVNNVATATADDGTTDPSDPAPFTPENPNPGLRTVKTVTSTGTGEGGTYKAGEVVEYQITVENTGNTTLNNIAITDVMSNGAAVELSESTIASLAPGQTAKVTAAYTVTQADVDAGARITNTATATTGDTTDPSDPAPFDPEVQKPGLQTTKTVTSTGSGENNTYKAGDVVTYDIVVENTGNTTLNNIVITDEMTNGAAAELSENTIATLAPGESKAVTATYTVTQADVDAGVAVENIATATAGDTTDPSDPAPFDPEAQNPGLQTTKTITSTGTGEGGTYKAGEVVEYEITVENTGNTTLNNISIADTMSNGATVELSKDTIASLAPGASEKVTATYTVTQADVDTGATVNNVATATADNDTTDPSDPAPFDPEAQKPGLQTTKTVTSKGTGENNTYKAGDVVTYDIVVENTGNTTLNNIVITDEMTNGATVELSENTIASLAPNEAVTVTGTYIVAQADVDKGVTINNVATATSDNGTTDPSEPAPFDPEKQNPDLETTKTVTSAGTGANDTYKAGKTVTYEITVENTGNTTLNNIAITDVMSNGATVELSKDTIASLAPGASEKVTATYTVTQADVDTGIAVNNIATATADNGTADESDPAPFIPEAPNPGLQTTKTVTSTGSAEGGSYRVGDVVTYDITVKNTGNTTLSNIAITDTIDNGGTVELDADTIATLAPGDSQTVKATYTVTQADVDANTVVNNVATATAGKTTDTSDPAPFTPENPEPGLRTVKTVTSSGTGENNTYKAGDVVKYDITVENTGNTTLNNISIADTMSNGATVELSESTIASLAPGQTAKVTATYTVTQTDVDSSAVVNNIATATADDGTTDPSDPAPFTPEAQNPSLETTKTVTSTGTGENGTYRVGDVVTYDIIVENTGNTTLNNIAIADTMSNGAKVELSENTIALLAPGATATVTATYTVTQADVDAGTAVNNVATATAEDGTTDPSDPAPFDPEAQNPGLETTKNVTSTGTGEGGTYKAGDLVTYDITVKNTGNTTLNNIVITDAMSNSVTAQLSESTIATLAPGEVATVTATYTVTQADIDAGVTVDNVATATADDDTTDPSDPAPFDPEAQNPGLQTTKTVTSTGTGENGTYKAGDVVEYEIAVENIGNITLNNVAIADTMSNGATVELSADTIASVAPGETATVSATYTVTQADVDAGAVVNNVATATADNGTTGPSDPAPFDPEAQNPGLQTIKTVTSTGSAEGGSYRAGDVVTYDITVKNTGNTTLNNIVITDAMSNGAAVELSADTIATLAPGASEKVTATYTVTQADVDANAVINNIATATAEGGTTDPSDPAPFTPENPTPGLRTVKTVTSTGTGAGGTYNAGDVATYEITVENTGNTTQNNIVITDVMTNGAAAGLSEDIIASLAPDETATVTATYMVTQADVDAGVVINNVATATSENGTTDPSDPAPITPNPPNPPTPPVTPPTPPVTPPTTPPVTPPVTPPGTVPPDSPIAPVIAPIVEVLEDAVTPLAGPNETEIDDNGTPLANQEHPYCWVHFYLILGIIVSVIYGACVALRRSLFSRKLKKYEDNLTGGGDPAPGTTTGADDTVSIPKGAPATAAVGLGE